jgi:hypothetical protein
VLPAPDGSIDDIHDADITPETIIPPWHGERLDLDYAIYTCLANEQLRRDREAGHDSQDDLPPRHPGIGEPVDLIAAISGRFARRPQPQPYAPIQIPVPV